MHTFYLYVAAGVLAGTPLLLAATGELLSERVGVINLGVEGLMLMGAVIGIIVTMKTGSQEWGLLAGAGAGAVYMLLFYAIPVVVIGTEQVLPGFGVWFIGLGLSQLLGNSYVDEPVKGHTAVISLPLIDKIPFLRSVVTPYPWPVYLAFLLPFGVWWLLSRTSHGRSMRSIGEDPVAAATGAGLTVRRWQTFYIGVNGLLGGFAGAVLAIIGVGDWGPDVTAGRGFLALAVVIFASWRPLRLLIGAYLFGGLLILSALGGALQWPVPSQVLDMMPYLGTIIVMLLWAAAARRFGAASAAPAALAVRITRRA